MDEKIESQKKDIEEKRVSIGERVKLILKYLFLFALPGGFLIAALVFYKDFGARKRK